MHDWLAVSAGILSATLIGAGGYVVNDFFDLPIDRINKPHRPLPAGQLQPRTAYFFGALLFIAGLNLSLITHKWIVFALAFLNLLLLFQYARVWKRKPLTGNLVVSWAAGSTFLFGGLITGNVRQVWPIAVYAFLLTLIREWVKDLEDVKGDSAVGGRTLAMVLESRKMLVLCQMIAGAMLVFSVYLLVAGLLGTGRFALLVMLVHVPLPWMLQWLRRHPNVPSLARVSLLLKLDMLIVLGVFLVPVNFL